MNRLVIGVLVATLMATGAWAQAAPAPRDGSHDFDFALGTYRTHIRRLDRSRPGEVWLEMDGAKRDAAILGGAGSLEEITLDGPDPYRMMTLRLYNASNGQWSLNFSNAAGGQLAPPAIGEFRDGVGTFTSQEEVDGRSMMVRQIWSGITPRSYHFEEAFSADHGVTWRTVFIADLVRTGPAGS